MKSYVIKIIKHPFFIMLLMAVVISGVILYATLKWLDSYTRHNEAVVVPDIKVLKVAEAAAYIKNSGLHYNIIDSVYSKNVAPGAIVEILPAAGSKVKEGRILFLTVNALTSQMGEIPEVEDLSFRQAYAILKGRGFESVEIEYVHGVYKDLAIGVAFQGRLLSRGDKVPLNASLILKVSSGETEGPADTTTGDEPLQSLDSETDSWF
jgi:beta-lactam-binding protein with PASTA domain